MWLEARQAKARLAATERVDDIVPRWEWRVFGDASLVDRLSGVARGPVEERRQETYVLSCLSPHNVKVRSGRIEVKRLELEDRHGLELWRPALKATFPLDEAALNRTSAILGVSAPSASVAPLSEDEFLGAFVAGNTFLRTARVTKQRTRLEGLRCSGELVALDIDGAAWTSVALEDADPLRVTRQLAELGFDGHSNTNYPAALKGIAGLTNIALRRAQEAL